MQNRLHPTFLYHLLAIGIVFVWGTTFVSTKVILRYGLSPADILFYRFIIAYILIWFIIPRKEKKSDYLFAKTWKDELLLCLAGLSGGSLYFLTENTALEYTQASNVSFILCSAPLFTAILLQLFHKETRLQKTSAKGKLFFGLGSVMALLGVGIIIFNGKFILHLSPIGDILCTLSALVWGIYTLIVKNLENRYTSLFITQKVFFYGIITLLPYFWAHPLCFKTEILFHPLVLGNLLFLGIVASLLCFWGWNIVVKNIHPITASNYIYLSPIVTTLASYLFIGEKLTWIAFLGAIIILGGVILAGKSQHLEEESA